MGLWSTQTSITPTRTDAGGDVLNGLYYLVGGYSSSTFGGTSDHQSFNPSTNTWTSRAAHKSNTGSNWGTISHAAQTQSGTLNLVGGGNTYSPDYDYWRTYSAGSNTWTQGVSGSAPIGNEQMFAEQVSNTGYYFGGYGNPSGTWDATTQSYSYNFTTHAFTAKAALPAKTYGGGTTLESASVTSVIHCYGGTDGSAYRSAHRTYTPSSNTWSTKAPLPSARTLEGAAVIVPGVLGVPVIFGGNTSTGQLSDVWSYSAPLNAWTQRPPNIPASRAFHVSFSFVNDRVNLVSGSVGGNESGVNTYWNADNPPNAPVLAVPANNAVYDPATPTSFSWTFSDPDSGDHQSAYAFAVKDITAAGATQWWNATTQSFQATEVYNTSNTTAVSIPSNKFTAGHTYQWTVSTQDTNGPSVGPYAGWRTIVTSTAPQVVLLAPNGVVTSLTTQRAYWSYSQVAGNPQTNYQIKVFTQAVATGGGFDPNTSAAVWDSGIVASAVQSAYIQGYTSGAAFYVYVRAASAGPNWSSWVGSGFSVSSGAGLGTATRMIQSNEYVFQQLTTQVNRPVPNVDTDAAVQNSQQPVVRLALGSTDYTPTGSESGGVVPGEVFTGGTLDSTPAEVISHTTGTASYTLQQNWTADDARTVYTVGVLNNMPYDMAVGQPRRVAGASNQRRLVFLFRLPHPAVLQPGDSFETDVTVTY